MNSLSTFRSSTFPAVLACLIFLPPTSTTLAWDKGGHMIVAQVAYTRLNATARAKVDALAAQIKDPHNVPYNFVNLAAWMDDIKLILVRTMDITNRGITWTSVVMRVIPTRW